MRKEAHCVIQISEAFLPSKLISEYLQDASNAQEMLSKNAKEMPMLTLAHQCSRMVPKVLQHAVSFYKEQC